MHQALAIHEAYRRGDLEGLKALLGDPPDFPNCRGPAGIGEIILEYAIYHGPLAFIRTLLEQGADPNYQDRAGVPALIAALSAAPGVVPPQFVHLAAFVQLSVLPSQTQLAAWASGWRPPRRRLSPSSAVRLAGRAPRARVAAVRCLNVPTG